MANPTDPNIPQILYSSVSKKVYEGELFIRQHVVEYIISGTSNVYFGGKSQHYKAGDFRFAVKNRLSKFTKEPGSGGTYQSVVICIDQGTLEDLSAQFDKMDYMPHCLDNVFKLNPNHHFQNYIDSLSPYLKHGDIIDKELVRTKIREAVLVFLTVNPGLKNLLFDFSEPGKIDLEAYMDEHYQYSGDLKHFAYLTGRSLSTFKRDFEKIYRTTPGKWLSKKKLEYAYYLLKEKKLRSKDVYLEAGFNDYSHFLFAFKKLFGVSPSAIVNTTRQQS